MKMMRRKIKFMILLLMLKEKVKIMELPLKVLMMKSL